MSVYFYSRVSTDMQTVENQREAVRAIGMTVDHWYADEGVSGSIKALDRPQFALMFSQLKEGDTVMATAVDRIGRNTVDVVSTVEALAAMKVRVICMTYGNLDLTSEMGMMIMTMGVAFAALERASLKRRTREGMAVCKKNGVKLGQPLKITPEQMKEMLQMQIDGDSTNRIAKAFALPRNTVDRNLEKWVGNLEGYTKEYNERQEQYKLSKAKKEKK